MTRNRKIKANTMKNYTKAKLFGDVTVTRADGSKFVIVANTRKAKAKSATITRKAERKVKVATVKSASIYKVSAQPVRIDHVESDREFMKTLGTVHIAD